jgi:hypothetical protein
MFQRRRGKQNKQMNIRSNRARSIPSEKHWPEDVCVCVCVCAPKGSNSASALSVIRADYVPVPVLDRL